MSKKLLLGLLLLTGAAHAAGTDLRNVPAGALARELGSRAFTNAQSEAKNCLPDAGFVTTAGIFGAAGYGAFRLISGYALEGVQQYAVIGGAILLASRLSRTQMAQSFSGWLSPLLGGSTRNAPPAPVL